MSDCNYGSLTAAYHPTFENIVGQQTWEAGYPGVLSGGARKKRKKTKRRSEKIVRGARSQTRPSASYYYNTLNKQVGYKVSYRPRKGGKYILHKLALRKNGTPFWKALEKLPKRSKKTKTTRRPYHTMRGGEKCSAY